jgi:hypothetical protein
MGSQHTIALWRMGDMAPTLDEIAAAHDAVVIAAGTLAPHTPAITMPNTVNT